jgi:hypothetical protein
MDPGGRQPVSVPDSPSPRDIPVAIPGDLILVHQPGLLAYAGAFTVSSAGFEFMVRIARDTIRDPELRPQPWALHLDQRDHQTWLEARFADGRVCAYPSADMSENVCLEFLFGEDRDGCSDTQWWVSPLPPPGPVELTLHLGEATGKAALDAAAVLDAAATVQET